MEERKILFLDWRKNNHWLDWLKDFPSRQIFFEGQNPPLNLITKNRLSLTTAETLFFYSLPPGPEEGKEIIRQVEPQRVYLIFQPQQEFSLQGFLGNLLGMVKFTLENREGVGELPVMSSALGERQETVGLGLEYLSYTGLIDYQLQEGKKAVFTLVSNPQPSLLAVTERRIKNLLEETKAFRRYLQKTSVGAIKEILS